MKDKLPDLRQHLFEAIEMVKSGDLDVERAKVISELGGKLIDSAKVEVAYINTVGGISTRSDFIEGNPAPQPMRLVQKG
jgi:hypothetical protein